MSIANQIPDLDCFARDFMEHCGGDFMKHCGGCCSKQSNRVFLRITKLYKIDALNDEEESETKQLIEKMNKVVLIENFLISTSPVVL